MKRRISRMWQSGIAFLMVLCLMVGLCPMVTFAQETKGNIKYVSLGDSMTNGYCFTGYEQGDLTEDVDFYKGDGVYGNAAYPNQFADWLEKQGYQVEHAKLAPSAMRAEDLNYLLGGRERPADDWFEEILGYTDVTDAAALSAFYVEKISEADLITMCVGNASFGAYMLHTVTDALGLFGASLDKDEQVSLEMALIDLEPEQKQLIVNLYNQMKAEFAQYIPADLAEQYNVYGICDVIAYTAAGFVLNYKGSLERIVELNPDAEIILIGLMNTTYGMTITAEGVDPIPVGDIMDGVFGALNAYIAGLPAVMQAAGEWQDTKFYYADDKEPLFISQQFANLKANNWGDIDDGRLSGTTVRKRNITAYNDDLREVISEAFGDMLHGTPLPGLSLEEVQTADVHGGIPNASSETNISAAIYLGIEDAVAASTDTMEIPLTGLMKIATDLTGVFADFEMTDTTPAAIRTALGTYLTSTDELKGMCKIYALFKVGNGMSVHPTPAGHDNIAKAVIAAYETNHTAKDETIENVQIALGELYQLLEQYGPEAAEQAYQYAVDAGYVAALNTAISELKAELEARTKNYINEAKPAMEAAIEKLQAEAAALNEQLITLKAELEAKKAELEIAVGETAEELKAAVAQLAKTIAVLEGSIAAVEKQITDIGATIENLKNGLSALEKELAQLSQAVAGLENAATAVMNVLKSTSGSVNEVIAAVNAAKKAVQAALDVVVTSYEQAEALISEVSALAASVAEKINTLAEMVKADLLAAYEALPEDVKVQIAVAVAEIKAAAEEAMAVVMTELETQIAALKAELQPIIDAKVAELEKVLAQIEAEVEAKAAELKADVEAKIAELTATAEAKKEELIAAAEAKKAELEAELARMQAQLEALKKELESAAEDVKAKIEAQIKEVQAAIAEIEAKIAQTAAELEAQIAQIVAGLEAAVAALQADLEAKIAEVRAEIEKKYAEAVDALKQDVKELKSDLDAKIAELTAAAEAKIAEIKAAAEAKIAELTATGEAIADELAKILEEAEAVFEAVKAEAEAIAGETIDNVEELIAVAKAAAPQLAQAIREKVQEVIEAVEEAYINATTSDYVPGEDSFYVAIGDSSAMSQSYVDMLAEDLGVDYANLAREDLMIEETYAVLEQNAGTVAKADLITVGFTSNGFVNKTIDQVLDQAMGGAAALDWAAYVGEENVPYVQEILAEVNARIAESAEDASTAAMMSAAVEAYAYSCVAYACNLPEVINAIRAINPDATIIIVGMYNPLEGMSLALDENTSVNVGEYLDYLTTAAGIHATAYCMLTSNGVYIAAPDVQTVYEADNGAAAMTIQELIYEYLRNKGENMLPSELGHKYIAAQIANALGKDVEIPEEPEYVLYGDVDMDGDVDGMDLLRLQKHLAGDSVEADLKAADVNVDGTVDGLDLLRLQKHLAGDNVTLG